VGFVKLQDNPRCGIWDSDKYSEWKLGGWKEIWKMTLGEWGWQPFNNYNLCCYYANNWELVCLVKQIWIRNTQECVYW
jgi:hypothetical protein